MVQALGLLPCRWGWSRRRRIRSVYTTRRRRGRASGWMLPRILHAPKNAGPGRSHQRAEARNGGGVGGEMDGRMDVDGILSWSSSSRPAPGCTKRTRALARFPAGIAHADQASSVAAATNLYLLKIALISSLICLAKSWAALIRLIRQRNLPFQLQIHSEFAPPNPSDPPAGKHKPSYRFV